MARPAPPLPMAPALLWWQLGLRWSEMLWASAQVIGTRTQRMALAGPRPGARDRREFTRMGTEKLQAAGESALALWSGLPAALAVQQGAFPWLAAWGEWARLGAAGLAPIHAAATANARRLHRATPRRRSAKR